MRILFLNHNLREHGTWFRAFPLARELTRRGHEATIWTAAPHHWYRTSREICDGVRIVETPSWNPFVNRDDGWGPLDMAWRSARILREPFDLVYAFAHPPNVYLPMRLAQCLRGKPAVVDWCDVYRDGIIPLRREIRRYRGEAGPRAAFQSLAERAEGRMERAILRRALGVTVISTDLARAASEAGVPLERVLHFPTGADTESFHPLPKAGCRGELGLEGEGPFLGYVANYNPDERFLLDALGSVARRYPSVRIVSTAPPFTRQLIERNGLAGHVLALGRQPFHRVNTVLGACDVLLLPLADNASNRGRWPNKFGDYLAAGRPIAGNAVGDIAQYFAPGNPIGRIAPPEPEAYAEAILAILERPGEWDAMGQAARGIAEGALSWQSIIPRVETFLESAARRNPPFA